MSQTNERERPWWDPTGLPYRGKNPDIACIEAWGRRNGGWSRYGIAYVDMEGSWKLSGTGVSGRAPTVGAAREAADRVLLAEVFRAREFSIHSAMIGHRYWSAVQVREILEGAAGANLAAVAGCSLTCPHGVGDMTD